MVEFNLWKWYWRWRLVKRLGDFFVFVAKLGTKRRFKPQRLNWTWRTWNVKNWNFLPRWKHCWEIVFLTKIIWHSSLKFKVYKKYNFGAKKTHNYLASKILFSKMANRGQNGNENVRTRSTLWDLQPKRDRGTIWKRERSLNHALNR